jgi:glycerate 2-kinase
MWGSGDARQPLMDKPFMDDSERSEATARLRVIAVEAIRSCDAGRALDRALGRASGGDRNAVVLAGRPVRLAAPGRILVLACGKAAAPMHEAFVERLRAAGARRPVQSLVIAPAPPEQDAPRRGAAARRPARGRAPREEPADRRGSAPDAPPLPSLRVSRLTAEHPAPGSGSFRAGRAALRFMGAARPADDVVALVSGGGSSLLALPLAPFLTPAQKTGLHRVLVASGAPIASINVVRKHLSAVKGGRLAVAAYRARSLTTMVLCDVDTERFEEVASGPTTPDRTTLDDMVAVIDRHGLATAIPDRVLDALRSGRLPETPKPKDPAFRRARAHLLLSNADLRHAAVRAGLTRGLAAEAMPTEVTGPVEEAVELVARAIEGAPTGLRLLVLGGETRTAPAVAGAGGRAQEFALRLALRMRNLSVRGWAFLAAGSDGIDGRSPAAGASVDATTLDRAAALGLDAQRALARAESWRFFHRLGDGLVTGPTTTNVRDIYLLLTGLPHPAGR